MARYPRSATRRRVVLAVLAAVTVAAGLVVHRLGTGTVGDVAGDALYALLVYLLLAFLMPRTSRSAIAALAILFCSVIELLQLTDLPQRAADVFPPAVLMLGAGFDTRDLIVYAFVIIVVMLVDVALSRSIRRRRRLAS